MLGARYLVEAYKSAPPSLNRRFVLIDLAERHRLNHAQLQEKIHSCDNAPFSLFTYAREKMMLAKKLRDKNKPFSAKLLLSLIVVCPMFENKCMYIANSKNSHFLYD